MTTEKDHIKFMKNHPIFDIDEAQMSLSQKVTILATQAPHPIKGSDYIRVRVKSDAPWNAESYKEYPAQFLDIDISGAKLRNGSVDKGWRVTGDLKKQDAGWTLKLNLETTKNLYNPNIETTFHHWKIKRTSRDLTKMVAILSHAVTALRER